MTSSTFTSLFFFFSLVIFSGAPSVDRRDFTSLEKNSSPLDFFPDLKQYEFDQTSEPQYSAHAEVKTPRTPPPRSTTVHFALKDPTGLRAELRKLRGKAHRLGPDYRIEERLARYNPEEDDESVLDSQDVADLEYLNFVRNQIRSVKQSFAERQLTPSKGRSRTRRYKFQPEGRQRPDKALTREQRLKLQLAGMEAKLRRLIHAKNKVQLRMSLPDKMFKAVRHKRKTGRKRWRTRFQRSGSILLQKARQKEGKRMTRFPERALGTRKLRRVYHRPNIDDGFYLWEDLYEPEEELEVGDASYDDTHRTLRENSIVIQDNPKDRIHKWFKKKEARVGYRRWRRRRRKGNAETDDLYRKYKMVSRNLDDNQDRIRTLKKRIRKNDRQGYREQKDLRKKVYRRVDKTERRIKKDLKEIQRDSEKDDKRLKKNLKKKTRDIFKKIASLEKKFEKKLKKKTDKLDKKIEENQSEVKKKLKKSKKRLKRKIKKNKKKIRKAKTTIKKRLKEHHEDLRDMKKQLKNKMEDIDRDAERGRKKNKKFFLRKLDDHTERLDRQRKESDKTDRELRKRLKRAEVDRKSTLENMSKKHRKNLKKFENQRDEEIDELKRRMKRSDRSMQKDMLGRMSVMRKRVEEAERNSRRQKKGWFWRRRRKKRYDDDDDRRRRRRKKKKRRRRDDYYEDDDYYDDRPRRRPRRPYRDYDYYDDDYYGNGYGDYYDNYGADYYGDEGEEYPDDFFGDEDEGEHGGPEGKNDFIPKNSAKNKANDKSVPERKAPPKDDAEDPEDRRDRRDDDRDRDDRRDDDRGDDRRDDDREDDRRDDDQGEPEDKKPKAKAKQKAPRARQKAQRGTKKRGGLGFLRKLKRRGESLETELSRKEGKKDDDLDLQTNRSRRKVLKGLREHQSDINRIRRSRHGNHPSQESWAAEDLADSWRGLARKLTRREEDSNSEPTAATRQATSSKLDDDALVRTLNRGAQEERKAKQKDEVWSFSVPWNEVPKDDEVAAGKKHHPYKKPSDTHKKEKEAWSFGENSKESNLEASELKSKGGKEEVWNFGVPYTEKQHDDVHKAEVAAGSDETKETTWSFSNSLNPHKEQSKEEEHAVWSFSTPLADTDNKRQSPRGVPGEVAAGVKEQTWNFSEKVAASKKAPKAEQEWGFSDNLKIHRRELGEEFDSMRAMRYASRRRAHEKKSFRRAEVRRRHKKALPKPTHSL